MRAKSVVGQGSVLFTPIAHEACLGAKFRLLFDIRDFRDFPISWLKSYLQLPPFSKDEGRVGLGDDTPKLLCTILSEK